MDVVIKNHHKPVQSFRDPGGKVFIDQGRVFRLVRESALADLSHFLDSSIAQNLLESGNLVWTRFLRPHSLNSDSAIEFATLYNQDLTNQVLIEHERIPFPSYPYEWGPAMLHAAADLTLEFAETLIDQGMGIKDATPYNILFRGSVPVFVDLLSFEQRRSGDPVWMAYAQFVRTFLLPLLVNKHFGTPLNQLFLARRDGLEPEEVYKLCGNFKKLHPAFFELVSLPHWLAKKTASDSMPTYQSKRIANDEKARFILKSLFKRLRRLLNKLKPREEESSVWSDYLTCNNNYSAAHFQAKQEFVREAISHYRPKQVLDVGCNTGHFSILAAQQRASVVALDYDPIVIDRLWQRASAERLEILPLVVDLTRPTPAIGWRNQECVSFLDRAHEQFDCVLMLAVVHHMLVTERIPLPEIIDMAATLTHDLLIVEYVDPADSMFRRLTRGRESLHQDLTVKVFEDQCRKRFEIIRTQHLEQTDRWLYLLRRK